MVTGDVDILKELLGSVYLTERQKQALGRLISGAKLEASLDHVAARSVLVRRGVSVSNESTLGNVVEEDRRHALLGPCGAE